MNNTLIWITYDGTNYSGFQSQSNAVTIQEKLEKALELIYKQPVKIKGAGRTDSGVHARGQAANFLAPFRIMPEKLPYALNALLPPDVVVTAAEEVAESFHARYNAQRKVYSYTLDRAVFPQVMRRFYSWHLPEVLDLQAIRQAAQLFEGTHDFGKFQASGSGVTDTVRTLFQVQLKELPEEKLMVILFEGNGFLYRMVRLITGTLIRAGRSRLDPGEIEKALRGESDNAAGPSAPPWGLCLERVKY
ncbi:MAG: tRNA pseudouridine(38-40) synthase TruA [Bacillota bacterium]